MKRGPYRKADPSIRFFSKALFSEECWVWTTSKSQGYGRFKLDGRMVGAHTFSYRELIGPIGAGTELDHLCRNRACVNPGHLEPVTHIENMRRGEIGLVAGAKNRSKTHCPYGHPYDGKNLRIYNGKRSCRACAEDYRKEHNKTKKP